MSTTIVDIYVIRSNKKKWQPKKNTVDSGYNGISKKEKGKRKKECPKRNNECKKKKINKMCRYPQSYIVARK